MAPYESPEWHPAFEEYCETIFELAEDDLDVIQARIDDQDPIQETEIIMLTDNTTETKRLRPPTDTKRRSPSTSSI